MASEFRKPRVEGSTESGTRRAIQRRGHVLIVDDEKAIGIVVQLLLEAEHECVETTDPRHALSLLRSGEHFDAIICDVVMPELSGIDFFIEVSRIAPEQADRIIFMSGAVHRTAASAFLEQLPNLRIDKPFTEQELLALVRQVVGR